MTQNIYRTISAPTRETISEWYRRAYREQSKLYDVIHAKHPWLNCTDMHLSPEAQKHRVIARILDNELTTRIRRDMIRTGHL
ncbi:MAG: hypothetical protein KC535_05160 [Nanoarchaeota archaeon]|nr:hypothetical protein [Nanoarchaeota archaeon]